MPFEYKSYDKATGEFNCAGHILFTLVFEDYNYEEDMDQEPLKIVELVRELPNLDVSGWDESRIIAALRDKTDSARLQEKFMSELEEAALTLWRKRITDLFGNKYLSLSHGEHGELDVCFSVNTYAEAKAFMDLVYVGGGDDCVYEAAYYTAQGFMLEVAAPYKELVPYVDVYDWLEENKPNA